MPPMQVQKELRDRHIEEKDMPTLTQLNNFKSNLKNDTSSESKFRLKTYQELKDYFKSFKISTQEQYELLGTSKLKVNYILLSTFRFLLISLLYCFIVYLDADSIICLGIHEAPMNLDGDATKVVQVPSFVYSSKGSQLAYIVIMCVPCLLSCLLHKFLVPPFQ